jgi:hypothetical protein
MNQIVLYIQPNPIYIGAMIPYQVGLISTTGVLTNITPTAVVEVIEPISMLAGLDYDSVTNTANFYLNDSRQNVTGSVRITYTGANPLNTTFCFVQPLVLPTQAQLYNTLINLFPKGVFNLNAPNIKAINSAIAATISQLYITTIDKPSFPSLATIIDAFYPSGGNVAWEQALVGTNSLVANSTDYNSLLQLLYQINTNNNTNPYFLALNISKYIYFRLGASYSKYVYIGENILFANASFIMDNNRLGAVILNGESSSDKIIIYVINDGSSTPLTAQFQMELYKFVRRIIRAGVGISLDYTHTFTALSLTPINDTYWGDPNQQGIYCIKYNPNELAEALGYTNPTRPSQSFADFNLSFTPSATVVKTGTNAMTIAMTANTEYLINLTSIAQISLPHPAVYYSEFYFDTLTMRTFAPGNADNVRILVVGVPGTYTGRIYWGIWYYNVIYTIT